MAFCCSGVQHCLMLSACMLFISSSRALLICMSPHHPLERFERITLPWSFRIVTGSMLDLQEGDGRGYHAMPVQQSLAFELL